MQTQDLSKFDWYGLLAPKVRELVSQSYYLLEREEELYEEGKVKDYGFLIFGVAKAYEGFLKDYLLSLGLIDEATYRGRYFRIGKALNPDLPYSLRREEWVYQSLSDICGEEVAGLFWRVWKSVRNSVFHFGHDYEPISLEEARIRVEMVFEAMEHGFACEVFSRGEGK